MGVTSSEGGGGEYDFYNHARSRIKFLVAKVGNCVYSDYTARTCRVARRTLKTNGGTDTAGLGLGRLPGPMRVGGFLSRCIVNRSSTGHFLSISICGRCGHLLRGSNNSSIRVRGSGVVVMNDANAKGALLTHAVTGLLRIPFAVMSTAILARTNCINRSVRDVLAHLLRITSCGIPRTRRNVIFVSRVSGVTHGNSGPSVAHSIDNRNIRRKLLGLLRNSIIGIPPRNKHGRPSRGVVPIGAGGVLFVYNKTFSNVRGGVTRQLGARIIKCDTMHGATAVSGDGVVRCVTPRSLGSFKLVPRVVNHLPILACLGPLSHTTLHSVLARPGGSVVGRCVGLFRVSGIGLAFRSTMFRCVISGTMRCGLKTHNLHSVIRAVVVSTVFRVPSRRGSGFIIALSCTGHRLRGTGVTQLRDTWRSSNGAKWGQLFCFLLGGVQ